MKTVSFTVKNGVWPELSAEALERLERLRERSDAEVEAAAWEDKDNPPLDEARLERMAIARGIRRIREKLGLSQAEFAVRFRIGLSRLRDWEQTRYAPDFAMMTYLQLIADHPALARELVEKVERSHLAA